MILFAKIFFWGTMQPMNIKKFLFVFLRSLPALCIFCISFYLSGKSTIENMPTFLFADKLVHFICFSGLSFWVAFACGLKGFSKRELLVPSLIVSLYGIIDEIHQSFIPGRMMSFGDWVTDSLGGIFGSLVFLLLVRCINNRQR